MEDKLYTEEEMLKFGKEKFNSGREHAEPSRATLTLVQNMRDEFRELVKDFPTNETIKGEIKIAVLEASKEIMDSIAKNYASKELVDEKIKPISKMVYIALGGGITGAFSLLLLVITFLLNKKL